MLLEQTTLNITDGNNMFFNVSGFDLIGRLSIQCTNGVFVHNSKDEILQFLFAVDIVNYSVKVIYLPKQYTFVRREFQ